MRSFFVRRIAQLLLTLVGVSILIFLLVRLLPGDVLDALGTDPSGAKIGARAELRRALGLSDPLPVQYVHWIGGMVTGDPGNSLRSGEPITTLLAHALPITLELVVLGVIIAVVVGAPLGIISASRPGRATDYIGRVLGMVGISVPNFWLATLAVLFTSSVFHWVPSASYVSIFSHPISNLSQLLLPAFCVSVYMMALIMRMLRATMLEVLGEDYVRTARAKGASARSVVLHHALRNALLPVITVGAFEAGVLLAGTALIEIVFGLPGLGNLLVQGIFNRDYTVVQTVTLLFATTFVVMSLVSDVLYKVIDPRVGLT